MKCKDSDLYCIRSNIEGKQFSLYNLSSWKNGVAFKNIHFSDTGVPVIKIAELNNGIGPKTAYTMDKFSDDVHLIKGDLVFSWSGNPQTSIDIFRFNLEEGWLNQHIFKLIPNNDIVNSDYFYFLMKFLKPYFTQIATNKQTIGLGHITIADLKKISVTIPPLETQQKIASILSALDDKIALNRKINENLEAQAQAIFDNLFPNITLGKHTIGNYIIPKRGKNLLSKDAIYGEVPVIAGGLKPATYHNIANTQAPVVTISASGANAGYVSLWNIPVWSSDSSFIDSSMTEDIYFWYILLNKRQKEIYDSQTGSAQPHIYPKHIVNMPIKELHQNELTFFTETVTPLFTHIAINIKENQYLSALRDTLLPRLMSGKIDVTNIDI